jgi:hypothetical protein
MELTRQKGIAMLLKGQAKEACALLKPLMNAQDFTLAAAETIAIAAFAAEDTDAYGEIVSMLDYYGQALSEKTLAYAAGTITLEDIFMKGTGDVL